METSFAHLDMSNGNSRITQVSGYAEEGAGDIGRIHEKASRFMEQTGREAKYLLVDSQTYLNLHAYLRDLMADTNPQRNFSAIFENINETSRISTVAGTLDIIVLPQTVRRLQVIGGNPLWTATSTIANSNR